eukprot:3850105-Amphidinium_carterae.1
METARVQHEADMKTLKDSLTAAQEESTDATTKLNDAIAAHIKTSEESAQTTKDLTDTIETQQSKISELEQRWCCVQ